MNAADMPEPSALHNIKLNKTFRDVLVMLQRVTSFLHVPEKIHLIPLDTRFPRNIPHRFFICLIKRAVARNIAKVIIFCTPPISQLFSRGFSALVSAFASPFKGCQDLRLPPHIKAMRTANRPRAKIAPNSKDGCILT